MTAAEALERRIDELCEENEKIRQERAYAYETGYIDGSTHYELEHCPACKNVADLQEALAENVKLRGARDVWQENDAKLRELVSVLAHCAAGSGCDSCPINGGCAQVGELDLCETAHDRMRELGVEVSA